MATFSTIFLSDSLSAEVKLESPSAWQDHNKMRTPSQPESIRQRTKVGDIYRGHASEHELSFVCATCSAEHYQLAEFCAHIQSHLLQIYSDHLVKLEIDNTHAADVVERANCDASGPSCTVIVTDDPIEANVEVKLESTMDGQEHLPPEISRPTVGGAFDCTQCGRRLQTRAALINHRRVHTRDQVKSKSFECFQCHHQLTTQYKCRIHIHMHRKLPFECKHCLMRFKSGKRHRTLCGTWNRYPCQSCPMKFHNSSALERHGALHFTSLQFKEYIPNMRKLSERQYTCRGCPFSAWDRAAIKTHVSHCDEVKVRCQTCKKLVVKRVLEHHMKLHRIETIAVDVAVDANGQPSGVRRTENNNADADDSDWSGHWSDTNAAGPKDGAGQAAQQRIMRKYKCSYCSKHVGAISSLVSHERSHFKHQIMPRSFECFVCHAIADNRSRCREHMRTHSDLPFECQYCQMHYNEYKFRMHQRLCGPGNRHECPSCPMKFHNASALTRHRKVHRERLYTEVIPNPDRPSERQFICKSCPFTTNARDKMHSHRRMCIASARPCNVCGKLVKMHCMRTHLTSHSDARDELCLICGKRFKNQYQLSVHMRSHRIERNFKCDLCQRPFKSANEVAMHRKRHFNKRTYICKMCERQHRSMYLLMLHLKSKHAVEVDAKDANAMAQYGYTKKGEESCSL